MKADPRSKISKGTRRYRPSAKLPTGSAVERVQTVWTDRSDGTDGTAVSRVEYRQLDREFADSRTDKEGFLREIDAVKRW